EVGALQRGERLGDAVEGPGVEDAPEDFVGARGRRLALGACGLVGRRPHRERGAAREREQRGDEDEAGGAGAGRDSLRTPGTFGHAMHANTPSRGKGRIMAKAATRRKGGTSNGNSNSKDRNARADALIARMTQARGYIYPEWEFAARQDPDFVE